MNKALVMGLFPPAEAHTSLLETMVCFNRASNWLLDTVAGWGAPRRLALQKHYYVELRRRFGLPAQMAIRCISRVFDAHRSPVVSGGLRFREHSSLPYDMHLVSFKGLEMVSLMTVGGRVAVPFAVLGYVDFRLSAFKRQSQLLLGADGQWHLLSNVPLPAGAEGLPMYDGLPALDVLDEISMFGVHPSGSRSGLASCVLPTGNGPGGGLAVIGDGVSPSALGEPGLGDSGNAPVLLENGLELGYGGTTSPGGVTAPSRLSPDLLLTDVRTSPSGI